MTVLFASNDILDFPGSERDTTAGYFYSERVPFAIKKTTGGNGTFAFGDFPFSSPVSEVWVHLVYRVKSYVGSNANGYLFRVHADNGDMAVLDAAGGRSRAGAEAAANVYGAETSYAGVLRTVDLHAKLAGGNLEVRAYYEDALEPQSVAITPSAATGFDMVTLDFAQVSHNVGTLEAMISEFIVSTESTIGGRLHMLTLGGDGALAEWDSGGAAELADDDISTFASVAATGKRISAALAAYSGGSNITALSVRAVARRSLVGPSRARAFLRLGGVNYDAAAAWDLDAQPRGHAAAWDLNPATGQPWTAADLAALEVGLESLA